ncbi:MAG: ABC transporter substrate-binding protein [Gemmataceae bacterium]
MRWYLLLFLFVVPMAGCWFGGSKPPVYVGQVAPPAGERKDAGPNQRRGIQLALQEVTDDPEQQQTEIQLSERGLGRPVVVVHVDASNSTKGAYEAAAVHLSVVNKVAGLVGGRTAAEVLGLDQEGLPVVSMAGIKTPDTSNRVYLTGLPPEFRGESLARVAASSIKHIPRVNNVRLLLPSVGIAWPGVLALTHEQSKAKPTPPRFVMFVDQNHVEFERTAEAFAQELDKQLLEKYPGVPLPEPTRWTYKTESELTELLNRLPDEQPDAIFVAGTPETVLQIRKGEFSRRPDGAKLDQQTRRPVGAQRDEETSVSFRTLPIVFGGLEGTRDKLLQDRRTNNKVYLVTAWTDEIDTEANKEFVKRFQKAYDEKPDINAALAYEAVGILFAGMRETKSSFTTVDITEKLGELEKVPNLTGAKKFNSQQVLLRPGFAIELRNGKIARLGKFEQK